MRWRWEEVWEEGERWYDVYESRGKFIASCGSLRESQLIAAAPELLERLKEAVALLDEFLCDGETKDAQALIQRLEGDDTNAS